LLEPFNPMNEKKPGLYIHIPFCLSKCHYCDFYSQTSISAIPDFLEALFKEMEMYRNRFLPFETVYLGGGTPSLLSPQALERILLRVRENFNLTKTPEMTIETNPADLSRSFLESMRKIGINRINIGIQSFNEQVLDFLGRRHSVKQALSALEVSREMALDNIGLDLIYGVPNQDVVSWLETLKQALAYSPEHISCYQLTLEPKTPLGRRFHAGEFSVPGEELQYEFFMKTSQFLEDAGYLHYEVSNFARETRYASRHNQKYWDHSPFLGLGPAAHSFQLNQRWWNPHALDPYVAAIKIGNFPIEETETLTMEQLRLEALYFGLRTKRGISIQDFKDQYHYDLFAEKKEILSKLEREGFISIQDGCLCPTQKGFAVADRLSLI
jgi:oxygen-independent coproporphyrinogen-3 oxidase